LHHEWDGIARRSLRVFAGRSIILSRRQPRWQADLGRAIITINQAA
jgi:hypothetical protein